MDDEKTQICSGGFVLENLPVPQAFFDGYCSTVQGLLDWFEVDLGFTKLSFIQIHLFKKENLPVPQAGAPPYHPYAVRCSVLQRVAV